MPSGPAADCQSFSGLLATMTVIAMGLGYAMSGADPTILSANMSHIRVGLNISTSTASFVASLASLTMAAAVLGAGTLGDIYGMRRMFVVGALGATVFGVLAAAAPSVPVLVLARAGVGVALAFLLALSLAIVNTVFPPGRRARAIALYISLPGMPSPPHGERYCATDESRTSKNAAFSVEVEALDTNGQRIADDTAFVGADCGRCRRTVRAIIAASAVEDCPRHAAR